MPKKKKPPRLSRKGYVRAFEVYGCEDTLFNSLKSTLSHFSEWRKQNPGDLELYQRYANSLGYDWERGSVTEEGIYTSYVRATATGGPPTYNPNNPPSPKDSPELPGDITDSISVDDIEGIAGEEFMAREPEGRFTAMNRQPANTLNDSRALRNRTTELQTPGSTLRSPMTVRDIPQVLQDAPGNLRYVPGEVQENGLGAGSIAHVAMTMLRDMVYDSEELTADDMADIKAVLKYFPKEETEKFIKGFQADLNSQGRRRFTMFSPNATLY